MMLNKSTNRERKKKNNEKGSNNCHIKKGKDKPKDWGNILQAYFIVFSMELFCFYFLQPCTLLMNFLNVCQMMIVDDTISID